MKLEKAIEILSYINATDDTHLRPEGHEALSLGIEALKRVQAQNTHRSVSQRWLLPGETEET